MVLQLDHRSLQRMLHHLNFILTEFKSFNNCKLMILHQQFCELLVKTNEEDGEDSAVTVISEHSVNLLETFVPL